MGGTSHRCSSQRFFSLLYHISNFRSLHVQNLFAEERNPAEIENRNTKDKAETRHCGKLHVHDIFRKKDDTCEFQKLLQLTRINNSTPLLIDSYLHSSC